MYYPLKVALYFLARRIIMPNCSDRDLPLVVIKLISSKMLKTSSEVKEVSQFGILLVLFVGLTLFLLIDW